MRPVLFQLGSHDVASYVVFHWLGIVLAVAVAARLASRRGLPVARTAVTLAVAGVGSFVGARLLSAALNPSLAAEHPETFLGLRVGTFHLEGALLVGVLVGFGCARALGLELRPLADVAAVAMGLRIAVLRVGCFLAGCCFGTPTSLPWGVRFPVGSHAWAHQLLEQGSSTGIGGLLESAGPPPPVHPTQLYELVAALLAAGLALHLHRRGAPAGVPGLSATAAFLVFRAVDWQLRAPTYEAAPWILSALSLTCAIICLAALWRGRRPNSPVAGLAAVA